MTKWLELAREDLGLKEIPGTQDNPKILAFYARAGFPEIDHETTPWCAAFVGACLRRAGLENSGSLAARSYLKYGDPLDEPKEGCIVVLTRGNPKGWEGHVGFYVGGNSDRVKLLGGNQGDAVTIASFPKSQVLGYRWPVQPIPPTPIADALKTAGKVVVPTSAAAEVAERSGVMEQLKDVTTDVGIIKALLEGVQALVKLVVTNLGPAAIILGVVGIVAAHWWQRRKAAQAKG